MDTVTQILRESPRVSRLCRAGSASQSLTMGGYSSACLSRISSYLPQEHELHHDVTPSTLTSTQTRSFLTWSTSSGGRIQTTLHIKVREKLEYVKCYSTEFRGKLCSDTAEERCTAEKRNDLLGPEPTTQPVASCLGHCSVYLCH